LWQSKRTCCSQLKQPRAHAFPLSQHGSSPQAASFRRKSAPPWSFQGLQGSPCSCTWSCSSLSDPGAHRAHFSHFFPHSSQPCGFSLLQSVAREAPAVSVMGSAVPCSGAAVELAGTGWNQPCRARGGPDLSSQRFLPEPGRRHLPHHVSNVSASFCIAPLLSPVDARDVCVVGYPGTQRSVWRPWGR